MKNLKDIALLDFELKQLEEEIGIELLGDQILGTKKPVLHKGNTG